MNEKQVKYVKFLLGAAIIAVLISTVDIQQSVEHVKNANPGLLGAGTSLFFAGMMASGLRWKELNNIQGIRISFFDSLKTYLISYSVSTVFFGNIGDLTRPKIQEKYTGRKNTSKVLSSVTVEKLLDLISVSSVIALSLVPVSSGLMIGWIGVVRGKALGFLSDSKHLVNHLFSNPRTLAYLTALSLTIWWLEAVSFFIIANSISSTSQFFQLAIVTSSMSLASAIPITPSGLGTTESTGYGLMIFFGFGAAEAASVIFVQRVLETLVSSTPGILFYFES